MPHKKSEPGWLSVTEVLNLAIAKPFLMYWYGKYGMDHCERIKRESQDIGTEVHQIIEDRFKLGDWHEPISSRPLQMVENFWQQFVKPYDVAALHLEVTHRDETLKIQGTFDAVIDTNKFKSVVADWKTSNTLDKISVPLQLCAYDYLIKGSGYGVAVRIDKEKDKVETHWYENLKQYWPVFEACVKVAKFQKFGAKDTNE